jgi:hypothetical protein
MFEMKVEITLRILQITVSLVMSLYQSIVTGVWTQYLGLLGLMRLIWWSSTWIVDLDNETLLVWSWLMFQVTLREPHMHQE